MSIYFQGSFDTKNQRHIQRHSWEQLNYLYQLKLLVRVSEFLDNAEAYVIVLIFVPFKSGSNHSKPYVMYYFSNKHASMYYISPSLALPIALLIHLGFANWKCLNSCTWLSILHYWFCAWLGRTNYSTSYPYMHGFICNSDFSLKQFCSLASVPELIGR